MKFCSKCGNQLLDESVICPRCGCQVENFAVKRVAKQQSGNIPGLIGINFAFWALLIISLFCILFCLVTPYITNYGSAYSYIHFNMGSAISAVSFSSSQLIVSLVGFVLRVSSSNRNIRTTLNGVLFVIASIFTLVISVLVMIY